MAKKSRSSSKAPKDKKRKKKPASKRPGGNKAEKRQPRSQPQKSRRASHKHLIDPDAASEAMRYDMPIASRKLLLKVIKQYNAMTFDEVAACLNMKHEAQLEALRRRLNAMANDGQVVKNRRGGYLSVEEADLVSGRVIAHPEGYGFLVPEEGGEDLYLSARQMRSLMHGDKAIVQVSGIDRRGRKEGSVVSVYERANRFVVGRLFDEGGVIFVVPDNKRLTQDIFISSQDLGGAKNGQIVKVEITKQPTFKRQPIGRVVEVLGEHMAPGMEIDIAIHNYGLPHEWSKEVVSEAAKLGDKVRASDKEGRVDLTNLPFVTIDGADAKDFDDAVYCERIKSGWRLLVAIADVAHYIAVDSALDKSAYERATSVYFSGRVIPMLPEEISNGLCSLNPDVERLCMVCEMRIDEDGEIDKYKFYEAYFISHARLIYDDVSNAIDQQDEIALGKIGDLRPQIEALYELYYKFKKARERRGAIEFDSSETIIEFTKDKRISNIRPMVRNNAHRLIEECMISANICAARFIEKNNIPALYRIHEEPDEDKIEDLRGFLSELDLKLGVPNRKIASKDYANLTKKMQGREDRHLVETLLLRSLKQAVYKPENSGHFGLALKSYAHFTSPIRRYPDLIVHRAIKHLVHKKRKSGFYYTQDRMVKIGEHCSNNERRADEATRDAEFALKCQYMLDKVGKQFSAHVTAVVSFGLFVELDDYYVEGLIHVTNLPKDYYEFDPVSHRLVGENRGLIYSLCDSLKVQVSNVDLAERKIDFDLVR